MKNLDKILVVLKRFVKAVPFFASPDALQMVVKPYPLFQGLYVAIPPSRELVLVTQENYQKIVQKKLDFVIEQVTEADDPLVHLFMLLSCPYRLQFLSYIQPYLTPEQLGFILGWTWCKTEFPHQNGISKMVKLFRLCSKETLMDEASRKTFDNIPEILTIYRGIQSKKARIRGLSWTTDLEKAKWFARRFNCNNTVFEAKIEKKNVFACFDIRGESEVVVNPWCLKEVKCKIRTYAKGVTHNA